MKHTSVSPVCKCITRKQCPWRSECIRSPGTGVTSVTWERESKSGPLKEQQILFHSWIIFSSALHPHWYLVFYPFLPLGSLTPFLLTVSFSLLTSLSVSAYSCTRDLSKAVSLWLLVLLCCSDISCNTHHALVLQPVPTIRLKCSPFPSRLLKTALFVFKSGINTKLFGS